MFYIPMRKVLKCLLKKRNLRRQERHALSLTECLLKESSQQEKRDNKILIVIIIMVLLMLSLKICLQYQRDVLLDDDAPSNYNETLEMCSINTTYGKPSIHRLITESTLERIYPTVHKGGFYRPSDCRPRHKVAILVPYRDRAHHLRIFLYNIHPFLMKQKLEYRIFVIEQAGVDIFNRGRLFNAGFKEVMKSSNWQCVIFHDVDLLPLDDRILYTCPIWPRNMCGAIVEEKDPTFHTFYGGVSAINVKHFLKVNGFSNSYWGWGGEDDDIYRRLHNAGIPVTKYDSKIALYTSLRHLKQVPNKNRYKLLRTALKRSKKDGISSLKYKIVSVSLLHLYTHFIIDINPTNKFNMLKPTKTIS